jgi:SAM-dependent methyltransferase
VICGSQVVSAACLAKVDPKKPNDSESYDRAYWESRFTLGDTPWELGRESSVVLEMLREDLAPRGFVLSGARVLSPGCGTGSDALELARRGARVIAIDWADFAVKKTSERYQATRADLLGSIDLRQADFFAVPPEPVDLVCEHTFLCALDPALREQYVARLVQWLKPGGFLAGNFFIVSESKAQSLRGWSLTKEGRGPVFVITESELLRLTGPWLEPIVIRPAKCAEPGRMQGLEWVCVFRKAL